MFKTANYKGQTLVIILLGTSVALTVALAVSVRTISTLKQTTTSSQAQQALAAAEAGAEVALGYLKDGSCSTGAEAHCSILETSAVPLSSSNTSYWYSTQKTGGLVGEPYILDLAKDNTQEVKLATYTGSKVTVCWWNPTLDGTTEQDNALELIYVGGVAPYTMKKYAYNGQFSSGSNGFIGGITSGPVTINGKSVSYNHCQSISGMSSNPQILRIKAFYSSFSAVVSPDTGVALPAQGFQILAYGKATDGSVKKAVRVTKSLPSLPGIFDFAIYSGSSTQPLSK